MSLVRISSFFDYMNSFCVPYSRVVITTHSNIGKDGKSPQREKPNMTSE